MKKISSDDNFQNMIKEGNLPVPFDDGLDIVRAKSCEEEYTYTDAASPMASPVGGDGEVVLTFADATSGEEVSRLQLKYKNYYHLPYL